MDPQADTKCVRDINGLTTGLVFAGDLVPGRDADGTVRYIGRISPLPAARPDLHSAPVSSLALPTEIDTRPRRDTNSVRLIPSPGWRLEPER